MPANQEKVTYFAETDFRNKKIKFGIKAKDRTRHLYIIGKTGMGKSTMLENMAVQDMANGEGMAFIDPHGGTAEKLLDYIPADRLKDTIYFAPFDTEYPVSFNVMEDVGADKRHLVANGLMNAFKKIWVDAWSARMEYILNNVLLALLEYPDATILGVNRMLSDKDYRDTVVANVKDASVKAFWEDEFAKYGDRYMQEAGAAIQNKIGQFVSNPLVRNIIGQPKSSFDIRKIMDEKKILIMNLSKGRMGIENSALLGNMLVTKIYLGAMSRADATHAELAKLPNFYFYVDEFQSFANESFADILSEARKYKLSLTIAHQYVNQMPEEVRDAVFGNVGSMVTFRIGPEDSELFEKEFAPEFEAEDFVNLGFAQIYLRLMIEGIGSKPFSATTLPPISLPDKSIKDEVIELTRKNFASPREDVESVIKKWYEPVTPLYPKPIKERKPRATGMDSDMHSPSRETAYSKREAPAFGNDVVRASPANSEAAHATAVQAAPSPAVNQAPVSPVNSNPPAPKIPEIKREAPAPAPRPVQHTQKRDAPKIDLKEKTAEKAESPLAKALRESAATAGNIYAKNPSPPVHANPVSLSELKPKREQGPTKNAFALRDALAAALKEKENLAASKKEPEKKDPPKEIPKQAESIQPVPKKIENQPAQAAAANNQPKEVPEDILKKLLSE